MPRCSREHSCVGTSMLSCCPSCYSLPQKFPCTRFLNIFKNCGQLILQVPSFEVINHTSISVILGRALLAALWHFCHHLLCSFMLPMAFRSRSVRYGLFRLFSILGRWGHTSGMLSLSDSSSSESDFECFRLAAQFFLFP